MKNEEKTVPLTEVPKTASWKRFAEYCEELKYATLIIKVDVHRGQFTQFEIIEEHRKFREELQPLKE